MKKKYICAFLLLIMLTSTIICSVDKIINSNNLITTEDTERKSHLFEENEFDDEFDKLVRDATQAGIIQEDIQNTKQPSQVEIFLTRMAVTFLLRPYLYLFTKYMGFKNWLAEKMKLFSKQEDEKDQENEPEINTSE